MYSDSFISEWFVCVSWMVIIKYKQWKENYVPHQKSYERFMQCWYFLFAGNFNWKNFQKEGLPGLKLKLEIFHFYILRPASPLKKQFTFYELQENIYTFSNLNPIQVHPKVWPLQGIKGRIKKQYFCVRFISFC